MMTWVFCSLEFPAENVIILTLLCVLVLSLDNPYVCSRVVTRQLIWFWWSSSWRAEASSFAEDQWQLCIKAQGRWLLGLFQVFLLYSISRHDLMCCIWVFMLIGLMYYYSKCVYFVHIDLKVSIVRWNNEVLE